MLLLMMLYCNDTRHMLFDIDTILHWCMYMFPIEQNVHLKYFMYNGNVIETVNSYCYLGIIKEYNSIYVLGIMLKCNGTVVSTLPCPL